MGAHAVSLGDRVLRPRRVRAFMERLADGAQTTIYVATYPRRTRVRVVARDRPEPLHRWARQAGIAEGLSGGFYVPGGTPLGELHSDGNVHMTVPFDAPWDACRSCVSVIDGRVEIVPRGVLPGCARGDLLQAGPLLVANGHPLVGVPRGRDPQGFSAGAVQFDCDITDGRHPRAAIGVSDRDLYLVTCDGRRTGVDAGLTLDELAAFMLALGCRDAMNLDGGGSTTHVHRGHLLNRPYSEQDQPAPASRPIVSAIVVERR
jgi:hypothetical protein